MVRRPAERGGQGNIPTEDLVCMLGRMGIDSGVDLDAAIAAARWIEQQVGRAVPGMLVRAEPFPGAGAPVAQPTPTSSGG